MNRNDSGFTAWRTIGGRVTLSVLVTVLWFSLSSLARGARVETTAPAPKVVVLRGTLSGSESSLTYVADLDRVDLAKLGGISGAEVLALQGTRLHEQGEFFRQAQLAAGTPPAKLQPLYVVLDPAGDWAYGVPWATISYVRDGKKVKTTTPLLKLGEKMAVNGGWVKVPEMTDLNRQVLEKLKSWYTVTMPGPSGSGGSDVVAEVLAKQPALALPGGQTRKLEESTDAQSTQGFVDSLKWPVVDELDRRGLDGKGLWARFLEIKGADGRSPADLLAEARRAGSIREIGETVSHELGHVVHFAALGLYRYTGAEGAPHMLGLNHSLQTLSNPELAFIEGWAEANSMVVVGLPKESVAGEANRIEYAATESTIQYKRNRLLRDEVLKQMVSTGVVPRDQKLDEPSLSLPCDQYRSQLEAAARKLGQSPDGWNQTAGAVAASPLDRYLERAGAYVKDLQSRKGQLKGRYDFLRSEYAVAGMFSKLRQALGPEKSWKVLQTLALHRPKTTAELLEWFCHDNPSLRAEVYEKLAEITEGILVTREQAAFVKESERSGRGVEIDIDRDGKVPGPSANAANPALFPAEPLPFKDVADPLKPDRELATSSSLAAAPSRPAWRPGLAPELETAPSTSSRGQPETGGSSGARTAPPAGSPDMAGVEAR